MKKIYHHSWNKILEKEFNSDYFWLIESFLEAEKALWKNIFPKEENIFNAFNVTKLKDLKVVILWQDPYHGENQAHGLSFSVQKWIKTPPSLRNIYKELKQEYWYDIPNHWELISWANQWVLLLNSILTVEESSPASHAKIGWEQFTDNVIRGISENKEWVIFLLWWAFAQWKKVLINTEQHVILETSHPSPFSAHRWFLWSQCFKQTNEILERNWQTPINWEIKDNDEQMTFWI
jgi:uracil-DNA glycosylase